MKIREITRRSLHRLRRATTRKRLAVAGLVTFAVLLTVPALTYAYYARDISDPERLMNRNNTGFALLDKNGEVIYSYGKTNAQKQLSLAEISDPLERAVIASEDKEFYQHPGYSVRGIGMALYANILNRDATRYGGSTITQQLVKNTLLTSNKNYLRKYQEFSIAIAIDRHYTKDKILEMYLNSVYFGEGAVGIDQAAKTYFNKSASELTLAESSMLIGLLPAPSTYSPVSGDKEKARAQQERVLAHMVEAGSITQAERDKALSETLTYHVQPDALQQQAPHYSMMVLEELKKKYGEEEIIRSGFKVTTTLDLAWQKQAEKFVAERVAQLSAQGGTNASLVAIDPKTGAIRALVGSADWNNAEYGKVNMALALRQPGSSFKPIYHAEAMERGLITPATILEDKPKTYGGNYKPENYDFRYRGNIPVRRSLALSLNITAVDVLQKLGVEEAAETAQRMGISSVDEPEKYGLSLALGTAETRLLDMTNAYAAFANQGQQHTATTITSIQDKYDQTVYVYRPRSKKVVSPEASFLISSILSDQEARAATFGSSLSLQRRPAAAKTGTTDKNRDAWTIGYTPSLTVGVWVGNNANNPMSGVAGSSGAAPIWRNAMQAYLGNSPAENFNPPAGIVKAHVCVNNGLRAERPGGNTREEFFIKSHMPGGKCGGEEPKPQEQPKQEKKEEKTEDEADDKKKEEEPQLEGGRGAGEQPKPAEPKPDEPPSDEEPAQPPPDQNDDGDATAPTSPEPTQPANGESGQ